MEYIHGLICTVKKTPKPQMRATREVHSYSIEANYFENVITSDGILVLTSFVSFSLLFCSVRTCDL